MTVSPRTMVAEHLATVLGDQVRVEAHHPTQLDNLLTPVCWVRIDRVTPHSTPAWWPVELTLLLAVGQTTPGSADDQLDQALWQVLAALEELSDRFLWDEATRVVLENSYPAYEVKIRLTVNSERS